MRRYTFGVPERNLTKLIRNNKCVLGKGAFGKVIAVTVS